MLPVHSGVGLEDTVITTWHPRALLPGRKVQVMVTLSPSTSTDADCTSVVSVCAKVNDNMIKFKASYSRAIHVMF